MGKYTEDEIVVIKKKEVGRLQLEAAIQMFIEKQYFAAITLAGAADGIFCGLIEGEGRVAPADLVWRSIEDVRALGIPLAGKITKKEAFKTWNSTRNALKHHSAEKDDEYLKVFPIDEAYEWIQRARGSAKEVGIVAGNHHSFDALVIPWFFLSE